jgi:DNA polymerase II large subunit
MVPSLAIKEIQIKTILRFHFIPDIMGIIKIKQQQMLVSTQGEREKNPYTVL